MPKKYINAAVTTPVTPIGIRVSSTNSIRLKKSNKIRKIAIEE